MRKLDIIEFLKGYSIFTIVVYHYLQAAKLPSPFDQLISFGGTGVHLFVLLSGFGLYLSYMRNPLPYPAYLKKRASKIYIPYIVVVLISALISLFIPLFENSWHALGGHIFLYKMFDESIIASYGYPLWFISMILQFYVAFYAIVSLAERMDRMWFVIVCIAVSIAWMALVITIGESSSRVWNSFFLRYLWEFALGMAIAAVYRRHNNQLPFHIRPAFIFAAGVAGCVLYAFLALKGGNAGRMLNDFPALIGYGALSVWIFTLNIKPVNDFFILSGKISFALYLLHYMVLYLALLMRDILHESIILFAAMVITYCIAVYYNTVMRHIYKFFNVDGLPNQSKQ